MCRDHHYKVVCICTARASEKDGCVDTVSWLKDGIKGCVCLSPTERFSMEVECHMRPKGNLFDCYRDSGSKEKDRAVKGEGGMEGVKRQIETLKE